MEGGEPDSGPTLFALRSPLSALRPYSHTPTQSLSRVLSLFAAIDFSGYLDAEAISASPSFIFSDALPKNWKERDEPKHPFIS